MAQIPDNVVELLRNQTAYAGVELEANPVVVFLQELLDQIEALETALGL